jgi:aldehyde:ferredoxin oxidoreductase
MMKVGERANTMMRLFDCREGFTPDDDTLPQRMHEGIGNGALKGQPIAPDEFLAARREPPSSHAFRPHDLPAHEDIP